MSAAGDDANAVIYAGYDDPTGLVADKPDASRQEALRLKKLLAGSGGGGGGGAGGGAMAVIEQQRLEVAAPTIDFSAIPDTYTHLALALSLRTDVAASTWVQVGLRLNGDAVGGNYNFQYLRGDAGTPSAASGGAAETSILLGHFAAPNSEAGLFSAGQVDVLDYADTAKMTTVLARAVGAPSRLLQMSGGRWNSLAAVDRVTVVLYNTSGNFVAGSVATLLGIA